MILGCFLNDDKISIVNEKVRKPLLAARVNLEEISFQVTKIIFTSSFYFAILFILVYPIPGEFFSTFVSRNFEIFVLTFGKLLWSICVSVIIFCCHRGYGGIINSFLSLPIFIPVSKMALSIYLSSTSIQFLITKLQSEPQDISSYLDIVTSSIGASFN